MNQQNSPAKQSQCCANCRCQLCTCGRHGCPTDQPRRQTEWTTSYDADFHPQRTPQRDGRTPQKQKNQIPFTGESSYKSDFSPKHGAAASPDFRGQRKVGSELRFDGTTTYQQTFSPPKAENGNNSMNGRGLVKKNTLPFHGNSHYRSDYTTPAVDPNATHTREVAKSKAKLPFDGHTSYDETYTAIDTSQLPRPCPMSRVAVPISAPKGGHIVYDEQHRLWHRNDDADANNKGDPSAAGAAVETDHPA